ncbi:helix-turn-helix domain-containing protein [Candidatus Pyrohabitans sp.]
MMEETSTRISKILARNLSHLRNEREISLTGLAERAGISKSTLSSLEAGEANPTISTLWALADALGVPFGLLVSETEVGAGTEEVAEAGVNVRLIEQSDGEPRIEVYLMRLEPKGKREATPHAPGVVERVFVINGRMFAGALSSPSLLKAGETFSFKADQPHVYIALDEPVSALVSVEYPRDEVYTDHYTILRPVPRTDEDWEGVGVLLRRVLEEVAQGVPVFRLKLYSSMPALSATADKIHIHLRRLLRSSFKWPVRFFVVEEQDGLSVLIFKWPRGRARPKLSPEVGNDILKQAANVLALACVRSLCCEKLELLHGLVKGDSLALSALAAEVLLHHGQPTVPPCVLSLPEEEVKIKTNETETPLFEHRINVHRYNFFELLHPGYASQSVVLAQIMHTLFKSAPVSVVDVGTGPGLHLRMLLELYPALEVEAVDPSPAACAYLRRNIQGLQKVSIIQEDFLSVNLPRQFPAIISVGASHHLNTSFLLQKAYDMLEDGGLLLVADEFISPYTTASERNRELIRHHTSYMLATLVEIPETVKSSLTSEEAELVELLNREIPLLAYEAESGEVESAIGRAQKLFGRMRKLKVPAQPSHLLLAFYRFQMLELEALMAGLDYEVERKTFPERFLALAESTGFCLEEHHRVYATSGYSDMDAGTHVFAFKKEV